VTHILAAFHLSRRKNGKNAAKMEDAGLNTYTEMLPSGNLVKMLASDVASSQAFVRRRTDKFH
jgi:hypothetical protein